ncbi:hypothetical protein DFH08DRAFT_816661 [Mycena albidolilacea]|uniref:F-box domain-containing protein n=1 Tax=Mycena albidolilacea TaxID=1033008 RepID=A0AAD7EJ60_9AGAR|nr:hypothetical protein DFH08DRAFT_816661 [Mycena albidolilacea]
MSGLNLLANELRLLVCSFLRHHDLVALMRVNNSFYFLIEPLLYTRVELHRPGYHEYYQYADEVEIEYTPHRNYHEHELEYTDLRADKFLKAFGDSAVTSDGDGVQLSVRRQAIANQVKFLCLPTDLSGIGDPLGTIAGFRNLEHLELTVSWPYDPKDWDLAHDTFALDRAPLAKLRTVRLRGYLPRAFVLYICRGAPGITDLELALLDRPIGSSLVHERKNPPPKWKDDNDEVDGGETLDDGDSASSNDSVAGEYDHEECIAPRALSTFDGVDVTAQFPALTRLSLGRPAESTNRVQNAYVSVHHDIGILAEWAALIRATRGTLEHLILDQRPFAEDDIEMYSTDDAEFLAMFPYGPGYARFVEHCLPALLEEDVQWPRLKSIRLYGFDVPPEVAEKYSSEPQRLLLMVEARFKPIGVDVQSDLGRRMMYEDYDGVIPREDGFGGSRIDLEEEEEEEEGEENEEEEEGRG